MAPLASLRLLAVLAAASDFRPAPAPRPVVEPLGVPVFAEPQAPQTLLLFPLAVDPAAAADAAGAGVSAAAGEPAPAVSAASIEPAASSHSEADAAPKSAGEALFDGAALVRSLDVTNDALLINGMRARELTGERVGGAADERAFVHPEDERLVVRTFYSHDSLAGFRRQAGTLESLLPLASAGAGARVIQTGELSIAGRGLVHFIVQEAIDGKPLAEQPRSEKALGAARRMIDRLAAAGLAVVVPATSDASWLYRRIVFGRTPSGGESAYLTRAEAERRDAQDARSHADVLHSFLRPAPGWTPRVDEPTAPMPPGSDLFGAPPAAKTAPAPIPPVSPQRPSVLQRLWSLRKNRLAQAMTVTMLLTQGLPLFVRATGSLLASTGPGPLHTLIEWSAFAVMVGGAWALARTMLSLAPVSAKAPRPSLPRRILTRASAAARSAASAFKGQRGALFLAALGWPAALGLMLVFSVYWPLSPWGLVIAPAIWLFTCFVAWSRHIDGLFKAIFVSTLMVSGLRLLASGVVGAMGSWGPGLGILALACAATVIVGGMIKLFRAISR